MVAAVWGEIGGAEVGDQGPAGVVAWDLFDAAMEWSDI